MDPFSPSGISGLQSGFVLAVILLAVFFAERLGGSGQLAQRAFQVVLGVALAFLVISGTTAFHRPAADDADALSFFESDPFADEEEALELFQESGQSAVRNAQEVRTIHSGVGLILVVGGLALLSRLRVLPIGFVLGGLLLLLFGGAQQQGGPGGFLDFFSVLFGALSPAGVGGAGQARDIAHFAVLLAGIGALAAFGFWRWERSGAEPAAQEAG